MPFKPRSTSRSIAFEKAMRSSGERNGASRVFAPRVLNGTTAFTAFIVVSPVA
jgi:hypothetical protein